jgi:hypothetical protein
MKYCVAGLTGVAMLFLLNLGPAPIPFAAAQGPARVNDVNSLAQFLKTQGYEPKIITPTQPNQLAYCLFSHENRMTVKAFGFPSEPVIELFVELRVPEKVKTGDLLSVLEINRNILPVHVYYDRALNKVVVHDRLVTNDLGQFKKLVGNLYGIAQRVHTAMNPPEL